MNVNNLRDIYPELISYMETFGYSKNYVASFKREIEKVLAAADSRQWSCYTDVYLNYTKTPHPLIFFAINGLSSEPLSSLMFMADIRIGDTGMIFSKEVLILCCHQNLNL